MTKTRIWLIQSIVLLIVGVVFLAVVQVVYMPKINAYTNATKAFIQNHTGEPPTPQTYGLDVSAMLVSGILNLAGIILTLLGSVFLVLTLAAKIISQSKTKVPSDN
jgi:hypothetical protein